ncbi:MAG: STT3 domain-containing protein, partial [Dehalococcoidia bacterium]
MSRFVIGIRSSTRAKYGIALTIIFGIAFFLRVYFPYEHVFAGDWVRFQQNDPWYHMRVIENFVQHFPHLMPFDPYGFYPDGQVRVTAPFYDLLLGFFIWIFGAGSPTKGLIETLSAYFPAILGALVTIPTFFIGKALFNKKAGLLAAALIAILPGEFLFRTLLGFNDHHAAEILFSTIIVLFLILAV